MLLVFRATGGELSGLYQVSFAVLDLHVDLAGQGQIHTAEVVAEAHVEGDGLVLRQILGVAAVDDLVVHGGDGDRRAFIHPPGRQRTASSG